MSNHEQRVLPHGKTKARREAGFFIGENDDTTNNRACVARGRRAGIRRAFPLGANERQAAGMGDFMKNAVVEVTLVGSGRAAE